jgi:hypothetical protein
MDSLPELIKNAPEIIKAAGGNRLALGAFFLALGVILIIYLLKEASPPWKFAIIVVWLAIGLLLFLIVVAPSVNYRARLGEDQSQLGKAFTIDLGYIEQEQDYAFTLDLSLETGSGTIAVDSVESPVTAAWSSGKPEETLSASTLTKLHISVPGASNSGQQSRRIRLVPRGQSIGASLEPLDLNVKFTGVPATRPIEAASGMKDSGRGQDFSPPYTVCADVPQPGDYVVVPDSIAVHLTGDRQCNSWSTCQAHNRGHAACLIFTLQGHSECASGFSGCNPVRQSEGHVRATAKLQRSSPRLVPAVT